jgi:autotransporter-associated beta strand protein
VNAGAALDVGGQDDSRQASVIKLNGGTLTNSTGSGRLNAAIDLGTGGINTISTSGRTNLSLGGAIGGDSVTIAGDGSVIFRGTHTYTGKTTISAGATLDTGGSGLAAGSGVINDGALILDQPNGTASISQAIGGSGTVTKLGTAGTVTLSGANTYTGTTTVGEGTLRAGAAKAFSATSAVMLGGGATLDLDNYDQTIGSLAGHGFVTLGSGTLTTGADNTSTDFMGVISGSGGLTKNGAGTLNLSTSTELAAGFTLRLSESTSLYGEVGKLWASGGDTRVKSQLNASVGLRVRW